MRRRSLLRAVAGGVLGGIGLARREARAEPWIEQIIWDAAARHGVSGEWLLNTARCESGLNPWSYNEVTGDSGVFQFNPETWVGWGGDPNALWDVWSQADMAAWAFSVGLHTHWCCSGTWQGFETCL